MKDGERQVRRVLSVLKVIAFGSLICLAITLIFGCKSIEYVPVESSHVEHHWHHDSVEIVDTFIKDKSTIIRELDSAAMAEYGIRLNNAERAFLVQVQEFEKQVKELKEAKKDTAYIEKEVQVPVPVERKLNKWEQFKMDYGAVAFGGSLVAVILVIIWVVIWIRKRFMIK